MKFEDEIKQVRPFHSEAVKAMLNVVYTANKYYEKSISILRPYGINDQHYNILRVLRGREGKATSPGAVKEVLLSTRGDLTRLIDKLVKMELVDRSTSDKDRRGVELKITASGLALLAKIDMDFTSGKLYDFNLATEEAKQLNTLLDRLRENLK